MALPTPSFQQFMLPSSANNLQNQRAVVAFASKSGGGFSLKSIINKCETCGSTGAIECLGCKGSGRNKKNGNIFERWKCYDCQGFGLKTCPACGKASALHQNKEEKDR